MSANPEPQEVRVDKVTALVVPDAPAKRRAGIPVPHMDRKVPEGHVDEIADVHSWDLR